MIRSQLSSDRISATCLVVGVLAALAPAKVDAGCWVPSACPQGGAYCQRTFYGYTLVSGVNNCSGAWPLIFPCEIYDDTPCPVPVDIPLMREQAERAWDQASRTVLQVGGTEYLLTAVLPDYAPPPHAFDSWLDAQHGTCLGPGPQLTEAIN